MQERNASFAALALCALLSGCASMGPQIDGWPQLEVREHHVPHSQMRERCARYSSLGLACAEVRFAECRCDIWFSTKHPPSAHVRRHEQLHCLGHDHQEDDTLRAALAEYRRQTALLAKLQDN